jgi:alanine racemase
MQGYSFKQIANIVKGKYQGETDCEINHLITDSRSFISPADSVFFALKGERHDGHKYVKELYIKKGLKNFIVDHFDNSWDDLKDARFIVVNETLQALQALASHCRAGFSNPVIGVTGSNGKTIVKEWLFQLLHADKHVIRSPKSYNSQVGVPLSVVNLEANADLAIFEAGISKPGEMIKLEQIIKPNIGIITNIGEPHQENFSSIYEKVHEKLQLFKNSDVVIYCRDYEPIHAQIKVLNAGKQKLLSWSFKEKADLQVIETVSNLGNTLILAKYQSQTIQIQIPFIDTASIENAIQCWLFMLYIGYSTNVIEQRMKMLATVAMRLELKKGISNCTIINDSYNSDIHSLAIALDFLNQQHQHTTKTLILSDILESGLHETSLYSEVARLIESKKVNKLIGIGPALFRNGHLFNCTKHFFHNTDDCIKQLAVLNFNNEAILLKGARSYEFERISVLLEQKVHRTVLDINLHSMVHNLNYFRSKLKPETKIMVMVKAFSYGSGSYEIANMLEYQKVDFLAVAFADEGVALRNAGISSAIVVMNPEEASFRIMVENNLQPEIYNFKVLNEFIGTLNQLQVENYPVHIKLDTGMHRLGFSPDEITELYSLIKSTNAIKVSSVFSHLAGSDEAEHDDFTRTQFERFSNMSESIIQSLHYPILRHILNSSGIERFPEAQFDMVRLGIGLYGISAVNQDTLENVSTLKTTILQTKTVPQNETIGYGRKGKAITNTRIAVIPIGYADGYSRILGNGNGKVWINGSYAPIIGNICMDMCMVNITGIHANEGDEVELFGNHVTIIDIAKQMNTIPYEVLTSISGRVKRIYFQE